MMQDKNAPLLPHLSEAEKLEIGSLVFAGLPLPPQYKERLFPSVPAAGVFTDSEKAGIRAGCPEAEASIRCGGSSGFACCSETDFQVCEYFPRQNADAAERHGDVCTFIPDAGNGRINTGFSSEEWSNLLIHGDNRDVLRAVADGALRDAVSRAGGIKLIYADPPFAVGSDFMIELAVGDTAGKAAQRLSTVAFTDSWGAGADSFAAMLFARIQLMHAVLAEDGSIYLHCDRRAAPLARLFMDHIFGPERMLGEIIWHYTGGGRAKRYFSRKHDVILHYAKSGDWTFNLDAVRVPYKESSGYARGGIVSAAGKHYRPHPKGTPVDDVWSIPIVNPMGHERLSYPTQKPEALLTRIIEASSKPGDLVADFFCGSGTTLAVAGRLDRKWIGADKGVFAIHEARKRLLSLGASPVQENEIQAGHFAVLECVAGQAKGAQAGGAIILDGTQTSLPGFTLKAGLVPVGNEPSLVHGFFVELTDCAFPKGGLAPQLCSLAESWPEWIDYWSVDYDYLPGFFQSRWQSFRTRRDRGLVLQSPVFSFPEGARCKGASFRAAILAVDVFSRAHLLELDTAALLPFLSRKPDRAAPLPPLPRIDGD